MILNMRRDKENQTKVNLKKRKQILFMKSKKAKHLIKKKDLHFLLKRKNKIC